MIEQNTTVDAIDKAWDDGALGRDEKHIVKVSREESDAVMAAIAGSLDLQAISIRLPKALIEDFKMIAEYRGLGYQPLMRQILQRFADSEGRLIMRELMEKEIQERKFQSEKKCA